MAGKCPDCGFEHETIIPMETEEGIAAMKADSSAAGFDDDVIELAAALIRAGVVKIGRGDESGRIMIKSSEAAEMVMNQVITKAAVAATGQSLN
jgi:hypothetical protein